MSDYRVTHHDVSETQDDLARDLGYESKADLDAKAEAERAKLDPEVRALADEMRRDIQRSMFGA